MRIVAATLIGLTAAGLAMGTPAQAQGLNDIGRVLQDQVLGGRPNQNSDRDAYERGRRDQEEARRDEDRRRNAGRDEFRREDDRRRAMDDRRQMDHDRLRADQQRYDQDQRRPGRY